jgi:hypothetical protein
VCSTKVYGSENILGVPLEEELAEVLVSVIVLSVL